MKNADLQEESYKIKNNCIEQKILQFENNNNTLAINYDSIILKGQRGKNLIWQQDNWAMEVKWLQNRDSNREMQKWGEDTFFNRFLCKLFHWEKTASVIWKFYLWIFRAHIPNINSFKMTFNKLCIFYQMKNKK